MSLDVVMWQVETSFEILLGTSRVLTMEGDLTHYCKWKEIIDILVGSKRLHFEPFPFPE